MKSVTPKKKQPVKALPRGLYMFSRYTPRFEGRKWVKEFTSVGPVRLMASAEGYSMVRNPGAMPFVAENKRLSPVIIPPTK